MTTSPVLLLIGAGALGCRHLQSMLALSQATIFVVEPNVQSQERAKQQLENERHIHSVCWLTELPTAQMSALPPIDVAIIATNAGPRFALACQLLRHWTVRFLILEKVLFQQITHLGDFQKLLTQSTTRAFVNCPRRQYPFYHQLRSYLSKAPMSLKVSGVNWGLACNSIHFIDLLAWMSQSHPSSLNVNQLLPQIFPSKRLGYHEVAGQLTLAYQDNSQLQLQCEFAPGSTSSLRIELTQQDNYWLLDEQNGFIIFSTAAGTTQIQSERAPFQSELTGNTVEKLLTTGECELTSYTESAALHMLLLQGLLQFFSKQAGQQLDLCPIT